MTKVLIDDDLWIHLEPSQSRVETSCSHRRTRDSARRDTDSRESARHHPVTPARRCDAAAARARRPTRAEAAADPRRPRIRFPAPPRPAPAARDCFPTRHAPDAARQRPGGNPVGGRAYAGLAASVSPPGGTIRAPPVYARSISLVSVLARLPVLLEAGNLILQPALSSGDGTYGRTRCALDR